MKLNDNKKTFNQIAIEIIAYSGDARSTLILALKNARNSEFNIANKQIKEATELLNSAHKIQFSLLQQEALGQNQQITLLMLHAQDLLMTGMLLKDLVEELIYLNKKWNQK